MKSMEGWLTVLYFFNSDVYLNTCIRFEQFTTINKYTDFRI